MASIDLYYIFLVLYETSFYLSNTAPVFFIKVFCDLVAILFFGSHFVCQNLFRLSIRTSMQNLDSVAQEMSELCSILRFGGHFVFWRPFCFSKKFQNLFGLSTQTSMIYNHLNIDDDR